MKEQERLAITFNNGPNNLEVIQENAPYDSPDDRFIIPTRNWNSLIENFNATSPRLFLFTPLECKNIIEYAKRSVPTPSIFRAHGATPAMYKRLANEAQEYEDKFQELSAKSILNEDELDLFHMLMRHPLRVLMEDIGRAEGVSEVKDWEEFEKNSKKYPEVQLAKMKARFKNYFGDKEHEQSNVNVQIQLGGEFIKDI